jgi:endonuclease YncB( thermonuclease family)
MKDWNPRIIPGRRRKRALPAVWKQYRPPWWRRMPRLQAGEIGLMVLAGAVLGLTVDTVEWPGPRTGRQPEPAAAHQPLPQPYPGSERSRTILEAQEDAPAPVAFAATPVRVIDGDTFDYGGMRVRVADIDTPETEGRCAYETQLAARATRRMRGLLAEGPFELHRLPNGRDEDRYGRKLRIVTRGGRSLGDQLVAEGLARTWAGRREPWC